MTAILALALIAQQPGGLVDNIDRSPLPDPEAELARWLHRPTPRPALTPERWERLIDAMGSRYSRVREIAQVEVYRRIKERPADAARLRYGLDHRDAEIRMRCGAIVRGLNPCRRCDATGALPASVWTGDGLPMPCWDCRGTGLDLKAAAWLAKDIVDAAP